VSSVDALREFAPEVAVVLGSGLGAVAEAITVEGGMAFADAPEMPSARIAGHAGRFVWGHLGGRRMVLQLGRVHLYENHLAEEVTAGIRLVAAAGARQVVLTNAAGILNEAYAPGDWMLLRDHINCTGTSPLIGRPAFIDMSGIYTPHLRAHWREIARGQGITVHEGVYAGVLGPQYETPAEIRMLKLLGADAVGMSTVLEAIEARALGTEIVGLSCLTNYAAGLSAHGPSHVEVLKMSAAAGDTLAGMLRQALEETHAFPSDPASKARQSA
jgi:purine-nucleoside phosphorylase